MRKLNLYFKKFQSKMEQSPAESLKPKPEAPRVEKPSPGPAETKTKGGKRSRILAKVISRTTDPNEALRQIVSFENGLIEKDAKIIEKEKVEKTPRVEKESFHARVAERYNEWLQKGMENGVVKVFTPQEFGGDWTEVRAEDYFVHRLSVLGLRPGNGRVTEIDIRETLTGYREKLVGDQERLNTIRQAYELFNEKCRKFGLEVGTFDPNRIYLVPSERIAQISKRPDHLAITMANETGDILIPEDAEELKDLNQLFDVVVHELGHQARDNKEIDHRHSGGSVLLEEGIIQANAQDIEKENEKVSRRTEEVYNFDSWVARSLAKALGAESLIGFGHQEIKRMMAEKYAYLGGVEEPYDMLIDNMIAYNEAFEQAAEKVRAAGENLPKEELLKIRAPLEQEKKRIAQMWFKKD